MGLAQSRLREVGYVGAPAPEPHTTAVPSLAPAARNPESPQG